MTSASVAIDQPTTAVLVGAEQCETGCGRLLFPAVDRDTRQRVIVELAADETAHWTWTYPEHTPERCREFRAYGAIPMIRDERLPW